MKRARIFLWIGVVALAACGSEPALVRQTRELKLIEAIRHELLESVVAEKSAVLATTDEESQALSLESQQSTAKINQLLGELRPLVATDGRIVESEKLDQLDVAWSDLEGVDKRLLALAVANTNLKAARLSNREGAAALDQFVDALGELETTATDTATLRALWLGAVDGLRAQSLLLAHIPALDQGEMARLEKRMQDLSAEVTRSLAQVGEGPAEPPEALARASRAWAEYQRISAEVLRLSRENTNVISFDVSIHEKRRATEACLAALDALAAAVESGPAAVR